MQSKDIASLSIETPKGQIYVSIRLSPEDETPVVAIDTPDWDELYDEDGPGLRLWLNDFLLHEGVELPSRRVCG